ncbi:hypothetical protein ACU4GD_36445 [Cupriavidus basilensis]
MTAHDVAIFAADKYQAAPGRSESVQPEQACRSALASNREFHAHRLLPLGRRENRLVLALCGPRHSQSRPGRHQAEIQPAGGRPSWSKHDKLMTYVRSATDDSGGTFKSIAPAQAERKMIEYDPVASAGALRNKTAADIDDAPVVRFLHKLLTEAFHRGASDLHFEPFRNLLPHPLPRGRRAAGGRASTGGYPRQDFHPHQGAVAPRTSPRSACRRMAA